MASLKELTVAIPGAGRRTLLAALREDYALPEDFRLCVLDAERLNEPRQLALLDELAADPALRILFVLNKADRITGPRTIVTRALALLRERGFNRPELFPICARAALLFRLPSEQIAGAELMTELGNLYFRYGPGEQSLSAFSVTREPVVCLGSREVSPERLRLALENTGLPMLETCLAARAEAWEQRNAKRKKQIAAADGREQAASAKLPPAGQQAPENNAAEPEDGQRPSEASAAAPAAEAAAEAPAAEPVMDRPAEETAAETPAAEPAAEVLPEAPTAEAAADCAPEAPAVDASPATDDASRQETADVPAAEPTPAPAAAEPLSEADALRLWAAKADCAELLEMAKRVGRGEAGISDAFRNEALDLLHERYMTRQGEELEALTQNAEELDLEALRSLVDRINSGVYTAQARMPYVERLNRRMDALQAGELAELCADVPQADADTLARIREDLERVDCAEVLKTDHFHFIEARQEQLDVEALERVTAGAEEMSEKELRALAVTLEAGNWNQKYVTAYRHRIELCREAAILRELNAELAELDDMERREVLELRERILSRDLPLRFTAAPLTRIDEKLYRMDMLRLIALNNDFDRLGYEELDELRAQAGRGDWCERARNEYLSRLLDREKALVVENTDARAQLVRQLIGQHKLRMSDFDIASASPAYQERLAAFWGGSGMEQARDIPVFLLDNASDFAFTGTRFYYKTGRDLAFLPLDNIERFQTMKQHMSLVLQVVGKDSSYRLTGARVGRSGAERVLAFLNECLRRWNEPGIAGAASASPIRTRRFEPAEFAAPVEELLPDQKMALEIFRGRCIREKLREGSLIREGEEGWEQRAARLLQNFGLPESTPLIWFNTTTLLGAVREGVALGPRAIYQKENKQPTQTIPLEEITELSRSGKQVTVSTVRNQSFRIDLPLSMLAPVQDYIKAIQLCAFLRERVKPE